MEFFAEPASLPNEVHLHIPEEGISALSNDLLKSFEDSNLELIRSEDSKQAIQENKEEKCLGNRVASHYNQRSETIAERKESRIFFMRNLNNWIKSRMIGNILECIRQEKGDDDYPIKVLDLGCGKGGDLLKWEKGKVSHVVCADIAETSIEQCRERYEKNRSRLCKDSRYDRNEGNHSNSGTSLFTAEFIATDCSKTSVRDKMKNKNLKLDLVSCQFAFHYSFESLPQAEQMLANVTSNLQPGGYFIGTTTDAYDIMRRLGRDKNPENRKFGNDIFSVEFPPETNLDPPPLFGAMYNFHLEEVVDCPEFLVHFPTFEKLAAKYGLTLVKKIRFEDFIREEIDRGKELLIRMKALEAYPPFSSQALVSQLESDYAHVGEYLESSHQSVGYRAKVGTLSKSEWEAVSLYLVFIFRKEGANQEKKRRHSPEKDASPESQAKKIATY